MATGTIKWFNSQKGYGFIQPDDGGKDIFVHVTAVQAARINSDRMQDGKRISYEIIREKGRDSAGDLRLL